MMEDPELLTVVATADRLNMLPSEVRVKATQWDFIQLAALNKVRDDDWRKAYEQEKTKEKSKTMSSADRIGLLKAGLRGG